MGSATFEERIDKLTEQVGETTLRGQVDVDQVYAQYQHEGLDLRHPRGGQAKYLEQPLFERARDYVQRLADEVLTGHLQEAMEDNMEDLAGQVFTLAPVEFSDLRSSAHPTVRRLGGPALYDRPPMVARLTATQLRAKSRLRDLGDSFRWDA